MSYKRDFRYSANSKAKFLKYFKNIFKNKEKIKIPTFKKSAVCFVVGFLFIIILDSLRGHTY